MVPPRRASVNGVGPVPAASEFAGQEALDEGVGRGKRFVGGGGWRLAYFREAFFDRWQTPSPCGRSSPRRIGKGQLNRQASESSTGVGVRVHGASQAQLEKQEEIDRLLEEIKSKRKAG